MDPQPDHVASSLATFLEEELSEKHLGLSRGARSHLDRFRSFLLSYHVRKHGWWPPNRDAIFSEHLYRSMYFDFSCLYDYIADKSSGSDALLSQRVVDGGLCVQQNIQAFDERHSLSPLPYSLPLLSGASISPRQSPRQSLAFKSKRTQINNDLATWAALATAINPTYTSTTICSMVQEYVGFEKEVSMSHTEKVSANEARKVRWILIYGVLQTLVSALRAGDEPYVSDLPTPALRWNSPEAPWESLVAEVTVPQTPDPDGSNSVSSRRSSIEQPERQQTSSPSFSIHPDCDEEYFGNSAIERDVPYDRSAVRVSVASAPVSRTTSFGLARSASFRSLAPRGIAHYKTLWPSYRSTVQLKRSCSISTNGDEVGICMADDNFGHSKVTTPTSETPFREDTYFSESVIDGCRTPTLEDSHLDSLLDVHDFERMVSLGSEQECWAPSSDSDDSQYCIDYIEQSSIEYNDGRTIGPCSTTIKPQHHELAVTSTPFSRLRDNVRSVGLLLSRGPSIKSEKEKDPYWIDLSPGNSVIQVLS